MIVLNFHCIGKPKRKLDHGEDDVRVERQQFVEILDAVAGRTDVRLTFDDGNKSDVAEALPELTRRGLHAEFFICPARFGTPEFVDVDDVLELHRAGMSVGSHGMDHVPWRRLAPSLIDREIVQAKLALENALHARVETAACPFGAYDRRTLRALRATGFNRVYTSDRGRSRPEEWLVPRNTILRSDSAESVDRLVNGVGGTRSLVRNGKRWIKQRR